MDQVEELEKYKELLDSGAITEDEFRRMKQKLLGLKTDEEKEAEKEAERAKALEEIETMRREKKAKEEEAERLAQEEARKAEAKQREREQQEAREKAEQVYSEEKIKEKARLDAAQEAAQEAEEARKAEKTQKARNTAKTAGSIFKTVVLWAACIILLFLGIVFILNLPDIFYFLSGIICLLLAAMACPLITSGTRDIPALSKYYQYKIAIVVVLIILFFIMILLA